MVPLRAGDVTVGTWCVASTGWGNRVEREAGWRERVGIEPTNPGVGRATWF